MCDSQTGVSGKARRAGVGLGKGSWVLSEEGHLSLIPDVAQSSCVGLAR